MTAERCPHCRAKIGVTANRRGGLRCKLCGGPRVGVQTSAVVLSGQEVPHLVAARKQGRAAWLWGGGSLLLGLFGLFVLLFVTGALLLFQPESALALVALLGFASLPLMVALWAWRKRGRAQEAARSAVHEANLSAARDVLRETGRALTAQEMATYLQLPPAPTEQILAELNVDDSVMSDITEAGEVTYRIAPLRTRIEEAYARNHTDEFDVLQGETPAQSLANEPSQKGSSLNKRGVD